MNERIKQLAKQAGDHVNEVYTAPVRSKTPGKIWEDGHVGWHTQFNQKFAQLIVKETMQVVANQLPSNQYLDVADAVLKHFGVEE